jgi:hypothetical protein
MGGGSLENRRPASPGSPVQSSAATSSTVEVRASSTASRPR